VSSLTTASNSSVVMINGGQPCNAYWKIGSFATLGTSTAFIGNIVALTNISLTSGAKVSGRVLARNGAVTLDNNTVSGAACSSASTPGATATASTAGATATATGAGPTATGAGATATGAGATSTVPTPTASVSGVISAPNTGSGGAADSPVSRSWLAAIALMALGGACLFFAEMRRRRSA
jgi:Ice-binding-like